MILEYDKSV